MEFFLYNITIVTYDSKAIDYVERKRANWTLSLWKDCPTSLNSMTKLKKSFFVKLLEKVVTLSF